MIFDSFYKQDHNPLKAQIYLKSLNYQNIINMLNSYLKSWGWRSHRERAQSLMKIVLYGFNMNKLENLKCVFLHQKYLFDKNTESIESEDPYFLNGFSLYVGSLGAGYITFDEFNSLLKVPSNINTSEFSQTSYYNLLKKILSENTSPKRLNNEKTIKIPLLFQNANSSSFTLLEMDCFKSVLFSIQKADYKVLAPILQFWANLFYLRQDAYFKSLRNKLYKPFDGNDVAIIYSNLFIELKRIKKQIFLSNERKIFCKNAIEKFLIEDLEKNISLDKEDYIEYINKKINNFWDFKK